MTHHALISIVHFRKLRLRDLICTKSWSISNSGLPGWSLVTRITRITRIYQNQVDLSSRYYILILKQCLNTLTAKSGFAVSEIRVLET